MALISRKMSQTRSIIYLLDPFQRSPAQATKMCTPSIFVSTEEDLDTSASGMLRIARVRSPVLTTAAASGTLMPIFVKLSPIVRSWDPMNRIVPRKILPMLPRESRRSPASRVTVRLEDGFAFLYVRLLPLSSAAHSASHAHRTGEAHCTGFKRRGRSALAPPGPTAPMMTYTTIRAGPTERATSPIEDGTGRDGIRWNDTGYDTKGL
jgi:hypothetical protein